MKTMNEGLKALTTEAEQKEIEVVGHKPVLLKRTFNQSDFQGGFIKYWRVVGPVGHPRFHSDLSVLGLQEAGIIPNKEGK